MYDAQRLGTCSTSCTYKYLSCSRHSLGLMDLKLVLIPEHEPVCIKNLLTLRGSHGRTFLKPVTGDGKSLHTEHRLQAVAMTPNSRHFGYEPQVVHRVDESPKIIYHGRAVWRQMG